MNDLEERLAEREPCETCPPFEEWEEEVVAGLPIVEYMTRCPTCHRGPVNLYYHIERLEGLIPPDDVKLGLKELQLNEDVNTKGHCGICGEYIEQNSGHIWPQADPNMDKLRYFNTSMLIKTHCCGATYFHRYTVDSDAEGAKYHHLLNSAERPDGSTWKPWPVDECEHTTTDMGGKCTHCLHQL
jgi:hypothetical protein